MLTFTCPSCHKGLKAQEALAGKKVKCPACRQLVAVPEVGAAPHEPAHPPIRLPPSADLPVPPPGVEPLPAVEGPAQPAADLHVPAPAADLPPAVESRIAYFAPAGYTASDPWAVPFKAPELRRRLGHPAAQPATNPPSVGGASPPPVVPDPVREPAPADSAPEARP
jgi:hypothetical protein